MKKFLRLLCILTLGNLLVTISYAQQEEAKPKHMVWEVQLTPAQLELSKEAIRTQNEFYKEKNFPFSNFTQYTIEGKLWYSVEFLNYTDLDYILATTRKFWESNPDKADEIQLKFLGSYKSVGRMILVEQPQLSYRPKKQEEEPAGIQFRFYEKCYIKQGKREEFEEMIKKYIKLRKKNGIKEPLTTLYPAFSSDLSVVYFIDELGDSPSEHYAMNADAWNKFGKEGKKLWNEIILVLDKVETYIGQADYDLIYEPSN